MGNRKKKQNIMSNRQKQSVSMKQWEDARVLQCCFLCICLHISAPRLLLSSFPQSLPPHDDSQRLTRCLQKHLTVPLHLCPSQSTTLCVIIGARHFSRSPTVRFARLNKAGDGASDHRDEARERERELERALVL